MRQLISLLMRRARPAMAVITLLACLLGMWLSARTGIAQLSLERARSTGRIDLADRAAELCPSNPEAHYARAAILINQGRTAEASEARARVLALRPRHYLPWLELGRSREQAGDDVGAAESYREAVRRAPFYAQPRWQLGSVLLKAGRHDEAFAELRRAATSDPALFPALVKLAWRAIEGDLSKLEQITQPQTAEARVDLARFFVWHGDAARAVALFRATSGVSEWDRRALLTDLLQAKRFREAYEVWAGGRDAGVSRPGDEPPAITNGGFEDESGFGDLGFGWRLATEPHTMHVSTSSGEAHVGARSLRVDWHGSPPASVPVLSQLTLVEPGARYQLRFAARTEKIVARELPIVVVTDASSEGERKLCESHPLSAGTSAWQEYAIEFETPRQTSAVVISLRRQPCDRAPCSILGRLWLDDFSLERLP